MKENEAPLKLEDLEIYQLAMDIGEAVWDIISSWEYLNRTHPGNQFIRAADSIAANISEGHGRFFFKEKRQFTLYGRGSLLETKTWLVKAHSRKLVTDSQHQELLEKLKTLHHKMNAYLKTFKGK
ncbi:MAG: four helix bundle protein [Bacteroidetes bacterium]|nr:four helix bundle protein [Bacteroidota bacterium]